MNNILLVMGGGAVGALGRYQLGRLSGHLFPAALWPWGTFAVNLLGGFAMGIVVGWLARFHAAPGESLRLLLAVGLLGGFTTFSSFSLEMVLMIERGQFGMAIGYATFSVVGAVAALIGGLSLMRTVA